MIINNCQLIEKKISVFTNKKEFGYSAIGFTLEPADGGFFFKEKITSEEVFDSRYQARREMVKLILEILESA